MELQRAQRARAAPAPVETGRIIDTPAGSPPPGAYQRWVNVVGGAELIPVALGAWFTGVGDTVIIVRSALAGAVIVDGVQASSRRLPGEGVVTASTGTTVTVTAAGVTYVGRYLSSYVPQVNDPVALKWDPDSGLIVLGEFGGTVQATPPPEPGPYVPAPVAPPVNTTGTVTFPTAQSSSFRGGKWRTDTTNVVQFDYGGWGDNHGAWFYGSTPTDRLAGATITKCAVQVTRRPGGDYAPQPAHLHLHTSRTRPGGDVTRTAGPVDVTLGIGETKWVDLPTEWGQVIVDTGGGIGITGSPYVVLTGVPDDPVSGLLSMNWTREVLP